MSAANGALRGNRNNEESSPNIRFGPSSFHAIPHRMDAENMYLPTAMPAAMPAAIAASSSGGTRKRKRTLRKRTLRERTLRKKRTLHTRRNRA